MSDTLTDALSSPGIAALIGAAQGFGNAAMPTRMPTPFAAVLGAGLGGSLSGLKTSNELQQGQQQTIASKMQNMATASSLPLMLQKNQALTNMWAHPEQMQQMMNGGAMPTGVASPSVPGVTSLADYATRVNLGENSTGNPAAKNMSGPGGTPTSSAMGNGQFLGGTWLPLFKQTFPAIANGMSDPDILALRAKTALPGVPDLQGSMTSAYAQQNAPVLQAAGIPPTATNLALAHRFGPDGAKAVIQAPPGAPASTVFGADVINANPTLKGQTAGNIVGSMAMRMGQAPVGLNAQPVADQGGAAAQPLNGANALTMAQQYEDRANQLDRQQNTAKWLQAQGMPAFAPPGDPAALRTAAQQFRALALAGPTASATTTAQKGVELQTAGPIAAAVSQAQLPADLAKSGFQMTSDGKLAPIGGGPADPSYVGQKAAAEAYSRVAPDLMEKGFGVAADGSLIPLKGGPADPGLIGRQEAARAQAEADASRTRLITTRAGVFDPVTGKEVYRQPEYHELQDPNTGQEYPAFIQPGDNGRLTVMGGPPGVAADALPPSKLAPGIEDQIKHLSDQYAKEDKQKYEGATNSLFQLSQQDKNIDMLNSGSPWSQTGAGANERAEWAKAANSAFGVLGIKPLFDPDKVASWEDAVKIQTQLAFAQAKQLGSREAQQVIQMSRAATPGAENTPRGYQAISAGYHEMNNREVDLYNFKTAWSQSHGGNLIGAETAFNNQNTPEMYGRRALSTVQPPTVSANSLPDFMAKTQQYLPGTRVIIAGQTQPDGSPDIRIVPARPNAPPIPDYMQQRFMAPPPAAAPVGAAGGG